ncbi:hypothetical protein CYMTET_7545 [Cymbomonas tetramitiformis]|uniref:Uncharacterized protein n=1 Tax=Cymbomonas tetramitiformis TaxID=36881 RepID=A0AAE0GUT5_9CHLO|nr:hypothetical protein CYMTET_7545 [Cymbomonas tetramitiformis]
MFLNAIKVKGRIPSGFNAFGLLLAFLTVGSIFITYTSTVQRLPDLRKSQQQQRDVFVSPRRSTRKPVDEDNLPETTEYDLVLTDWTPRLKSLSCQRNKRPLPKRYKPRHVAWLMRSEPAVGDSVEALVEELSESRGAREDQSDLPGRR